MRFMLSLTAMTGLLLFAPKFRADGHITSVDPLTAKTGDSVTASGEGIDNANIAVLYLTNGTDDIKVEIIERSDKLIRFKIPSGLRPGRWALMILTKGPNPKLMEQPVKITVE